MDYLFDVFLSHNNKDKEFVREIARLLRDRGLRPWLDEEQLIPGERWQDKLARGIRESATCAMFLGPNSLGDWQEEELYLVQNRAAGSRDYRLIPILLPGLADSLIPPFLQSRTWVDYRHGINDQHALHLLACSINGTSPGQKSEGEVQSNAETPLGEAQKKKGADFSESKPAQKQEIIVHENWGLLNSGTIIINNNLGGDKAGPEKGEIDRLSQREKEIRWLKLLQKEGGEHLSRYTPLSGTVRPEIKRVYELKSGEMIDFDKRRARSGETRRFDDAVGEILKLNRAVVLGEPGTGKTMTLWKIAEDLIDKALLSEKIQIPIMIRLGNWTNKKQPFSDFLFGQLRDFGDQFDRLLDENRAVLLLDGLNELPAGQRKVSLR
jgi:hypothetical protein